MSSTRLRGGAQPIPAGASPDSFDRVAAAHLREERRQRITPSYDEVLVLEEAVPVPIVNGVAGAMMFHQNLLGDLAKSLATERCTEVGDCGLRRDAQHFCNRPDESLVGFHLIGGLLSQIAQALCSSAGALQPDEQLLVFRAKRSGQGKLSATGHDLILVLVADGPRTTERGPPTTAHPLESAAPGPGCQAQPGTVDC